MKQFDNLADAQTLALAIVDTLPEPFVVLDGSLCVLAASRCFYERFKEDAAQTRGRPFFELGDGQWDIPALRLLIDTIVPEQAAIDSFEVEHDFLHLGRRIMLLNARLVRYEDHSSPSILIAFQDITERRAIEREKQDLLERTEGLLAQQQILLREMEHRIANSLQIIASILLLKAGAVGSEETRRELRDAHQRVMSVAAVQSHLREVNGIERIDISAYLTKLSAGLAASMIGSDHGIDIRVSSDEGTLQSREAVSLGLIVTELIINAIKYAFPTARAGAGILVSFEFNRDGWKLGVADNGSGRIARLEEASSGGGLGTAIVAALSKQLEAEIQESSSAEGLRIEVTHAASASHLPLAA